MTYAVRLHDYLDRTYTDYRAVIVHSLVLPTILEDYFCNIYISLCCVFTVLVTNTTTYRHNRCISHQIILFHLAQAIYDAFNGIAMVTTNAVSLTVYNCTFVSATVSHNILAQSKSTHTLRLCAQSGFN